MDSSGSLVSDSEECHLPLASNSNMQDATQHDHSFHFESVVSADLEDAELMKTEPMDVKFECCDPLAESEHDDEQNDVGTINNLPAIIDVLNICTFCKKVPLSRSRVITPASQRNGPKSRFFKFHCPHCSAGFDLEARMLDHLKFWERNGVCQTFYCEMCPHRVFICRHILSTHIRQHLLGKHHCRVCRVKLNSQAAWRQHTLKKHPHLYPCDLCNHTYLAPHLLDNHVKRVHLATFKCNKCQTNKFFKDANTLGVHGFEHRNNNKFKCQICSKVCRFSVNIRKHITEHTRSAENWNLHCVLCNEEFESESDLVKHEMGEHVTPVLLENLGYWCRFCNFRAISIDLLLKHSKMDHRRSRRYTNKMLELETVLVQCKICGYVALGSEIRVHLRDHVDQQQFVCSCGVRFNDPRLLGSHFLAVHEDIMANNIVQGGERKKQFLNEIKNVVPVERENIKNNEEPVSSGRMVTRGKKVDVHWLLKNNRKSRKAPARNPLELPTAPESVPKPTAQKKTTAPVAAPVVQSKVAIPIIAKPIVTPIIGVPSVTTPSQPIDKTSRVARRIVTKPTEPIDKTPTVARRIVTKPTENINRTATVARHTKPTEPIDKTPTVARRSVPKPTETINRTPTVHIITKPLNENPTATVTRPITVHPTYNSPPPTPTSETIPVPGGRSSMTCEQCEFVAQTRLALVVHQQMHLPKEIYLCYFCCYSTGEQSSMVKHSRVHDKFKCYPCKHCSFIGKYMEVIVQHLHDHGDPLVTSLAEAMPAEPRKQTATKRPAVKRPAPRITGPTRTRVVPDIIVPSFVEQPSVPSFEYVFIKQEPGD